jgi:hypothetical protein
VRLVKLEDVAHVIVEALARKVNQVQTVVMELMERMVIKVLMALLQHQIKLYQRALNFAPALPEQLVKMERPERKDLPVKLEALEPTVKTAKEETMEPVERLAQLVPLERLVAKEQMEMMAAVYQKLVKLERLEMLERTVVPEHLAKMVDQAKMELMDPLDLQEIKDLLVSPLKKARMVKKDQRDQMDLQVLAPPVHHPEPLQDIKFFVSDNFHTPKFFLQILLNLLLFW